MGDQGPSLWRVAATYLLPPAIIIIVFVLIVVFV